MTQTLQKSLSRACAFALVLPAVACSGTSSPSSAPPAIETENHPAPAAAPIVAGAQPVATAPRAHDGVPYSGHIPMIPRLAQGTTPETKSPAQVDEPVVDPGEHLIAQVGGLDATVALRARAVRVLDDAGDSLWRSDAAHRAVRQDTGNEAELSSVFGPGLDLLMRDNPTAEDGVLHRTFLRVASAEALQALPAEGRWIELEQHLRFDAALIPSIEGEAIAVGDRRSTPKEIGFNNADGIRSFTLRTPISYDAGTRPLPWMEQALELHAAGDATLFTRVDLAWARSAERSFPLHIDPTVSPGAPPPIIASFQAAPSVPGSDVGVIAVTYTNFYFDEFEVTLDWGDGNTEVRVGREAIFATHQYAAPDVYRMAVQVCDFSATPRCTREERLVPLAGGSCDIFDDACTDGRYNFYRGACDIILSTEPQCVQCTDSSDCGAGEHCNVDRCRLDCNDATANPCPLNHVCAGDGTCQPAPPCEGFAAPDQSCTPLGNLVGGGAVATNDNTATVQPQVQQSSHIWAVEYQTGTVSKISGQTGNIVARYPARLDAVGNSLPARTAVDGDGNVYVGNRSQSRGGVTKIGNWTPSCDVDVNLCECVDKNNNGVIDTSKDLNGNGQIESNEYLGANDECLLWTRNNTDYVRALVFDHGGLLWASSWFTQEMFQLDPATGNELQRVNVGANIFNAAIDSHGVLWLERSCCGSQEYIWFDPATGTASGFVPRPYSEKGGHGIIVDRFDRVWTSYYPNADFIATVFDPRNDGDNNLSTGQHDRIPSTCRAHSGLSRTVAIHNDVAWIVQHGGPNDNACDSQWSGARVTGVNINTFQVVKDRNIASQCSTPVGVEVDPTSGFVWIACQDTPGVSGAGRMYAMSPDPASNAFLTVGTLGRLFNHSYWIGLSSELSNVVGTVTASGQTCADGSVPANWDTLAWTSVLPPGTSVTASIKTAATQAGLGGAASVQVNPGAGNLGGVAAGAFYEVEFVLTAADQNTVPVISDIELSANCN